MERQTGGALIFCLFVLIVMMGLVAAVTSASITFSSASNDSLSLDQAYFAAESGVSYYLAQVSSDPAYFGSHPAPHSPVEMGEVSFSLASVTPSGDTWELEVMGHHGQNEVLIHAVIGYRIITTPKGLIVAGKPGETEELQMEFSGGSFIASFDGASGPLDLDNLNSNVETFVNGSADIGGGAAVYGSVEASGWVDVDGKGSVSASAEYGELIDVQRVDTFVDSLLTETESTHNNAALGAIFGDQWTPVAGEDYGDLIVDGGTYVIPPGDYRFRSLQLLNGAQVTFDTSTQASRVAFLGGDKGGAVDLNTESKLLVDPGTSTNGVQVLMNDDTTLQLNSHSVFGQAIGHEDSAAFMEVFAKSSDERIKMNAHSVAYGELHAPSHKLDMAGQARWVGTAVISKIKLNGAKDGPAMFIVDEDIMGDTRTDPTQFRVKARWLGTFL